MATVLAELNLWVATEDRLPVDGQRVWVKTQYGTECKQVTFFKKPVPRWEDDAIVCQFQRYAYWLPI